MVGVRASDIKIEALRIRREIESFSVTLWADVSGLDRSVIISRAVDRRLVLLVTQVEDDQRIAAFKAARQAAHVYRETSDVLHGRTRASRFGAVQVAEWQQDLLRLRAFLGDEISVTQGPTPDESLSHNPVAL
ncbi:UNVERIFIED_ORG: putative ATPase [Arthrobacter sp. UYCu721]